MNAAPLPIRRIRAAMALKEVTLRVLAAKAKIPYATASQILGGHLNDPKRLRALREALKEIPMPAEAAA